MFALNIPDAELYRRVKPHIRTLDTEQAAELGHSGRGARSFVCDIIQRVLARGLRYHMLSEVYAECAADGR